MRWDKLRWLYTPQLGMKPFLRDWNLYVKSHAIAKELEFFFACALAKFGSTRY